MTAAIPNKIWVADDEPNPRFNLYTRGNVGEVFPNVVSALTGTLIGAEVQRAQLEIFQEIGFITPRDIQGPSIGTGVFGGYLYGNGALARLMGVRTPGMSATAGDEQVFGTADGLPPYRRSKGDRNPLASLRVTGFLAKILRHPDLSELDVARASANAWVASMPPLATASDEDLLAFVHTYPPLLRASMKRLLHFSMIAGGPRALVDKALAAPRYPAGLANRLVGGIDGVDSAQLAVKLWALGRIVAADPALMAAFDAGLDGVEQRIAGTSLEESVRMFLSEHGHRGSDEYELGTPSWSMDSGPVFAAIDRLRHAPPERDPAVAMTRLAADRIAAEEQLAGLMHRPKRAMVSRAAAVSRAGSIGRERAKDILVLENLGARLALRELARRLAERGGPQDHRKMFCVTAEELPLALADPAMFAPVIEERATLERYLNDRVPPPWFEGVIPDPTTWAVRPVLGGLDDASGPPPPTPGAVLTGLAVSGGRAAGRARVIVDPGDPRGLEPGEILVCAITDPAWTPLFLVAAAVVCDSGAMQSHAAIVARELGIPAVMSVGGVTAVADGTWLDVDGDRGTVRIG